MGGPSRYKKHKDVDKAAFSRLVYCNMHSQLIHQKHRALFEDDAIFVKADNHPYIFFSMDSIFTDFYDMFLNIHISKSVTH